MPLFKANYPTHDLYRHDLLSTPERTNASQAYSGQGVVIAFIDGGFYPHPDIADRVVMHVDATTKYIVESLNNRRYYDIHDYSWHGQMTSVVAAGDGRVSAGRYKGIASSAHLLLIKVSNLRWEVKEADIQRGLEWLVEHYQRFNVRVLNLSVGGDFVSEDPEHPIYRAIRTLSNGGVTVVAAAGNRALAELFPPASAAEAITVGGVDDHNTLDRDMWTYYRSNYGSAYDGSKKPDVLAPAAWIASPILPGTAVAREARWLGPLLYSSDAKTLRQVLRKGYEDFGLTWRDVALPNDQIFNLLQDRINAHKIIDTNYQHVDGTSVSAAIVSSVIAQMLEANPKLKPAQIKQILQESATALSDPSAPENGTRRVLDARAAVQAASGKSRKRGNHH